MDLGQVGLHLGACSSCCLHDSKHGVRIGDSVAVLVIWLQATFKQLRINLLAGSQDKHQLDAQACAPTELLKT